MIPSDVPIHRPSVGAMAVTTGSQMPARVDKPYIYRGTGEDQFPETRDWGGDPKPKPTKAQLAEKRRLAKVARQRRADRLRAKRERARQRREREREQHRLRLEAKRAAGWRPGDEGRAVLAERRKQQAIERAVARATRQASMPRPKPKPAPGWKPLTGDDIDDLLNDL